MMIVNKLEQQKNNASKDDAIATHQRPSNAQRLAQWRAAAERTGNQRLLDTVDILEALYANESTRPPTPTLQGGEA